MEDERWPARAAEGNLKDEYYVGQFWKSRLFNNSFHILPNITMCPT